MEIHFPRADGGLKLSGNDIEINGKVFIANNEELRAIIIHLIWALFEKTK